jgi:drug/metabolite transporter (DMT)-like permease
VNHIGEVYALCTALCWAGTAMFFTAAGERIGSLVVNFLRLAFALVVLMVLTTFTRGLPLPVDATPDAWLWLSVSGVVGFALGDLCLFRAFVVLGPRLSTLVMSTAPLFAALIGFAILGETLAPTELVGMALTLGGVAWAVTDQRRAALTTMRPTLSGVLLAFGGAIGQGGGLVLSKYGMGDYDAFAANEIRIIAGCVGFVIIYTATGWWPKVWAARTHRSGLGYTALGAFAGPVCGVSLSLLAIQHTGIGVAASIMATTPILIIPIAVLVRGDKLGFGGIAGAILAVVGVVLLF